MFFFQRACPIRALMEEHARNPWTAIIAYCRSAV